MCLPGACSDSLKLHHSLSRSCFTPYSFGSEDKTSYSPYWSNIATNTSTVLHQSPWAYHTAGETGTPSTWGRHKTYSGGGYIIPLWTRRRSKMIQSLERLRNAFWVDDKTRAVVLEFTTFNPTESVLASTQLWFEFTYFGTIDSSHYVITLYQVHSMSIIRDIYRLAYHLACILVMHIYAVKVALRVWKMRHSLRTYFANIWSLVDWAIIITTYASIPMILWHYSVMKWISVELRISRGRKFISFTQLISSDVAVFSSLSAVYILLMIQVLRWSVYLGKRNVLFAFNISRARQYVFYIASVFCAAFVMTVLTSQMLFGSYCEGYAHFTTAVQHVARLFRNIVASGKNECVNDPPNVNLLIFVVAAFFVVLMWRALVVVCGITAQYTKTYRDEKSDLEFAEFLSSRLLIRTGHWSVDEYIAHRTSQQPQPEPRPQTRRRRRHSLLHGRTGALAARCSIGTQTDQYLYPVKEHSFSVRPDFFDVDDALGSRGSRHRRKSYRDSTRL